MFSSQVFAEWTCIYMYVWLAVNRHIAQGKAFYHDFDWWNEGAFCCLLNRVATNLRCLPLHLSHCLSHSLSLIHSQWLIYIYLPNAILTHSHTYNAHRTSQHIMHSCMYCNCKRQQQKREIQKKKNHRVSMHLSCKRRLRYEYCRFDLLYTAIGFKKTWIGFDASKRIK